MQRFEGVQLARGYFEDMAHTEGALRVKGWMLHPEREFDSFSVYLNNEPAGSVGSEVREDVAKYFPWIPHANHSGFQFGLHLSDAEAKEVKEVCVLGFKDSVPIARMSSLFRADLEAVVSTPPLQLRMRVTGNSDARYFKIEGLRSFGEFLEPIRGHRDLGSVRRLLDWGCGCGRVTIHFLLQPDRPEVFGCDVDHEAIAWCNANLSAGNFLRIDPCPPTPYEDAMFDVAIGYSVFTHLPMEVQHAWLAEMRRIIAPSGLFLASTHGEFASSFVFPTDSANKLRHGIYDEMPDAALDGIAPKGYYRSVYQTRDYTLREWSKYFEILEYIERGIGNFQDLVVMRRP